MKNKTWRVAYVRKVGDFERYTHFGIRAEILFRGFSKDEILQVEQRIREKIWEEIARSRKSGRVRDVVMEKFEVKPFKDQLVM